MRNIVSFIEGSFDHFLLAYVKNLLNFEEIFIQCNEIWRGEQTDNCEQICSSYFTA